MGTDVNSAPCDKSTFKLVLGVTQQFSGVSWVPNRFWRLLSDCVKEGRKDQLASTSIGTEKACTYVFIRNLNGFKIKLRQEVTSQFITVLVKPPYSFLRKLRPPITGINWKGLNIENSLCS